MIERRERDTEVGMDVGAGGWTKKEEEEEKDREKGGVRQDAGKDERESR